MELTVLGTSSALPTSERYQSAHVLNVHERFYLIDCGEGTQIQLRKNRIRFGRIDDIFISHLHGDHVFGIYGLLSSFNLMGRETPLRLYAPDGFERILNSHLDDFGIILNYPVEVYPLSGDGVKIIREDRYLDIFAFPLEHRVPTFGFLFREKPKDRLMIKECIDRFKIPVARIPAIKKGNDFITEDGKVIPNEELTCPAAAPLSYAYCSDTMYFSKLATYVKDVTLLYHESTYDASHIELAAVTGHSTARDAARTARDANVGKLLIGHFSSRYKNVDHLVEEARELFKESYPAEEGKCYKIGR